MKSLFYHGILIFSLMLSSTVFSQTAIAPSYGDGTITNPYQIATWQNLYWITQSTDRWDDYYIQIADIDLTTTDPAINTWDNNQGWTPIGNSSVNFTGSYDGQNHFIKGLYINRPLDDYLGLFGYTIGSGSIQKVKLLDGNVIGKSYVGTLVGKHSSSGSIKYCSNTGIVKASGGCIGGLVGENVISTIEYCYNTGTIGNGVKDNTGPAYIGGLVGHNWVGIIRNCYNTGKIDGGYWGSGGLVGYNDTDGGIVENCYSVGLVDAFSGTDPRYGLYRIGGVVGDCCTHIVINTFWDYQTAGTMRGHGTYKTTAQMKTQSTFTNWDFTNVWEIIGGDGANYPTLKNNPNPALLVEQSSGTPNVFNLHQNYPNPFNPVTTITFTLAEDGLTTLKIYDVLGREVQTIMSEELKSGQVHRVKFDGSKLASGIYFYKLESKDKSMMRKFVLMK